MLDKRISYKIVIDTETAPINREIQKVSPENMWVYDCGWAVIDKRGNVYRQRSFVNADIFLNEKIAMTSSYYSEKIPQYWEDIKAGKRILTSFYNIKKAFLEDIAYFNIQQVFAHNMRFDYGALNNTQRWLTKSKYRYFFPRNLEICDTLKMARDVLKNNKRYTKFCEDNEYKTSKGANRFTAEILYRFITNNTDFVESHTGLEDVMIEKEILAFCYRQHKKMRRLLF